MGIQVEVIKNKYEPSPVDRRKMQMIMLEMLIEFDRICRRYDIRYSLSDGTLLGAVREGGFIPWDPDLDVIIMRKDYERFSEITKSELDHHRFFLQDYHTDKYYRWGFARMLRKGTKFIRAGHEHLKSQNGIFMDIIIMDSVPDIKVIRPLHLLSCFCIRKVLWSEVGKEIHESFSKRLWFNLLSKIPRKSIIQILEVIYSITNKNTKSQLIAHMTLPHDKEQKYGIPREYLENLTEYNFEGFSFLGIKNADEYLTMRYGDYMTLPPKEQRIGHIPCSSYKLVKPNLPKKMTSSKR